jgi:hypothetical protein
MKFPVSSIHIIEFGQKKSEIDCDVYIDDYPENIKDYCKVRPKSLIIIMDRSWNGGFQWCPAVRAMNFDHAIKIIEERI